MLHQYTGACVRRVIDPGDAIVREHAHDWPVISLYVLGGYRNFTEQGERDIAGPSMVFYGAGVAHRNVAGKTGFEQIEIEFDPDWLGPSAKPSQALLLQIGGTCGALARALARACNVPQPEDQLLHAVRELLLAARRDQAFARPAVAWTREVMSRLRADPGQAITTIAHDLGRSPAWIGPAYRRCSGEGLQETAARFRVERATQLLRESNESLVAVAAEAGFCDQSHMNRSFRRVLGRSPTEIRSDREAFRQRP